MGKVTLYHSAADRHLECSESAYRDVYASQGWQLAASEPVAEPEPVEAEPVAELEPAGAEPPTPARRRR